MFCFEWNWPTPINISQHYGYWWPGALTPEHQSQSLDNDITQNTIFPHYDAINWKHFSRDWPFVWGIHLSPVKSSHKGQWRGALMFSLICAWTNSWVNNRDAGDLLASLWCHCNDMNKEVSHTYIGIERSWRPEPQCWLRIHVFTVVSRSTLKQLETHGCVLSTVTTGGLVLDHQVRPSVTTVLTKCSLNWAHFM